MKLATNSQQSVLVCKLIPFIITAEGDIDNFAGGKMEVIYQGDDQYFAFLEEQANEVNAEKNQSIITSVFQAFIDSRVKMRRRQVTGLPPMPVTVDTATSVTATDTQPTAMLPLLVNTIPEPLIPMPITEAPMQPPIGNSHASTP